MTSTSTDSTLSEYFESQQQLIQEASLALPGNFSKCTYPLGAIRQAVYLCQTCPETRGLCSSCSIACHPDHQQLELFPKRNFRCDCPTTSITHPCSLNPLPQDENTANHYGRNFKGLFCRCGRSYDATTERETMIQCLSCEDWYHESCLNLRERPTEVDESLSPQQAQPNSPQTEGTTPATESNGDGEEDAQSEASSSGLPPPLISADDYDSFVCASCVISIDTLRRFAGTPGVNMVTRESVDAPWKSTEKSVEPVLVDAETIDLSADSQSIGTKRVHEESEEPAAKRLRSQVEGDAESSSTTTTTPICLAPPVNTLAQEILAAGIQQHALGAGDVFLTEGFRDRWCRCDNCLPSLKAHPYLLEEEDTYEPPDDPDAGLSLEELGLRALAKLPRERAIDGIHAFNAMRDGLVKYLKPFAEQGKVVNDADVTNFFESLKNEQKTN